MPTLWHYKDSNIRKTWVLVTLFFVFIIALGWLFSRALNNPNILIFAVLFSVFMNIASYWWSDKIVIAMTRAKPIEKKDAPELYNIIENLSITAGLPTPKIYLVDSPQLNAFATGRSPKHAVVAVTTGLLGKLEKVELEGVLAHELSHIGNRDMLVSTVAVVLAGFIAILADMFLRMSLWGGGFRRSDNEDSRAGAMLLIVALVAAILAPIAAMLIRLAISRKRESLADASGVLLTRYPEGLARALEKLAADHHPMPHASPAIAHLWLDSPFKGQKKTSWIAKLFMTHPPIEERIAALRGMSV